MLKHHGVSEGKAWEFANIRKGYWRTGSSPILKTSLNNKTIASLGFMTLTNDDLKVCENQRTTVYQTVPTVVREVGR